MKKWPNQVELQEDSKKNPKKNPNKNEDTVIANANPGDNDSLNEVLRPLKESFNAEKDVPVDICHLEPSVGRCKAILFRFYFDKNGRGCKQFSYGGCGGNANNFVSKEDCENKCGSQAQPHSVENLLEPLLPHQSYSLDDLPNEELENNSPYYNNGQAFQNHINELLSVEPSGQKNKLGTYHKKSKQT